MRYLILIVAIVLCFTKYKDNKNLFRFTMIFYGAFLALRFGQGLDYFSYAVPYNAYQLDIMSILQGQTTDIVNFDVGYNILVGIFLQFGIPFEWFMATISIGMVALLYRFIVTHSKNYMLSFVVLYASYGVVLLESALRQCIACVLLVAIAIPFLEKKKYIKAGITMAVALSFHASSIVFSAVLLLYYIEPVYEFIIKNKFKIMIILVVPAVLVLNVVGLKNLVEFLPLPSFIETRLAPYIEEAGYSAVAIAYRLIMLVAVVVAMKVTTVEQNTRKLLYILATGYIIYFMIAQVQILSRITMYFEFLEIVLIPTVLASKWEFKSIGLAKKKLITGIATTGYIAIVSVLFLSDVNFNIQTGAYKTSYLPYISVFQKEDIEEYVDVDKRLYLTVYLEHKYMEEKGIKVGE